MVASTELRAEGHVEPAILQLVVMARDEARKLLGSVAHVTLPQTSIHF